ncbi:hypothetical protein H4R99_008652, partial [Coemansia sp. RSA 1722]
HVGVAVCDPDGVLLEAERMVERAVAYARHRSSSHCPGRVRLCDGRQGGNRGPARRHCQQEV